MDLTNASGLAFTWKVVFPLPLADIPELPGEALVAFCHSMPECFLLTSSGGAVLFANAEAGKVLSIDGGAGSRSLGDYGPYGHALDAFLTEVTSSGRTFAHRVRLPVDGGDAVHAIAQRVKSSIAILAHLECPIEPELHAFLVNRMWITSSDVRLLLRVYLGYSNAEIGRAFGVPVGTICRRLCDLGKRLGLRRRVDIVKAIDEARRYVSANRPVGVLPAPRPVPPNTEAGLRAALASIPIGFTAHRADGRVLWLNHEALRLLDVETPSHGDLETFNHLRGAAALAAARAPEEGPVSVRVKLGGRMLRSQLWRAGDNFVGARFHVEWLSQEDVARLLCERYKLSPFQSQVAMQIASGARNADIARTHSLRQGSISATSARIYRKLGVRNRVELVVLLASIGSRQSE